MLNNMINIVKNKFFFYISVYHLILYKNIILSIAIHYFTNLLIIIIINIVLSND